jgi:hypothetical protein
MLENPIRVSNGSKFQARLLNQTDTPYNIRVCRINVIIYVVGKYYRKERLKPKQEFLP